MALAVPLSRFTPRVGGGSAFFVRRLGRVCSFYVHKFMNDIIAIVASYKRDQWPRWVDSLRLTPGFDCLSFDEFFKIRVDHIKKLKIQGQIVHEVELDVDDYLGWVAKCGLPGDSDHRKQFAHSIFDAQLTSNGVWLMGGEKSPDVSR